MNNEIKEILDDLRTYKDRYEYFLFNNLSFSDRDYKAKILLDYITNLQDYKSRCEKAIEYIKYNDSSLYTFEPDYDYEENIVENYEPSNFREDLLNILNGDDNK